MGVAFGQQALPGRLLDGIGAGGFTVRKLIGFAQVPGPLRWGQESEDGDEAGGNGNSGIPEESEGARHR